MGRDRWPKTVREVALSHWPLRACGARRGRPAAQRTIPRRDWPRSSPHLRTVLSSEGTADTRSSHRPDHSGRTRELLPLVSGASAEDTFAALLWPVPAQEGHFTSSTTTRLTIRYKRLRCWCCMLRTLFAHTLG